MAITPPPWATPQRRQPTGLTPPPWARPPKQGALFSGGTLSDIFDVLQVGQFATAGLATGKGIRRGIEERASFGELLSPGFRQTLAGRGVELALNILGDPLTYVPFGAVVRVVPGVRAGARLVTAGVKPAAQRIGLALTERQAALQPIRDAMVIAERKGFDAVRGLSEDIRKATLVASSGNKALARELDITIGRYFDAGADAMSTALAGLERAPVGSTLGGRIHAARFAGERAQQEFLSSLPQAQRQVVEVAAQRIAVADQAISEGLVRVGQLSAETMEKWRGFHLRAIYTKFERPEDWIEYLEKTDPVEALRFSRQVGTARGFGKPAGVAIPTGTTARRTLLSAEREALGEIPTASSRVLVGQTLGEQAVVRGEALQRIAREFAVPESDMLQIAMRAAREGPEGFRLTKEFALVPDTARWGALRGKIVNRDVADVLILGAKNPSAWEKLIGWWKISKVVLNPPTRARNLRTNVSLAVNNAGIRALNPAVWMRAIREVVSNGELFRLAKSLDASFVDTFTNSELRGALQVIEGLQERGVNAVLEGLIRGVRFAGRTYQMEEQIGKMVVFLAERGRIGDTAAAVKAGKALFNYRNVPPLIEKMRRKGFYPFITFPWKVATEAVPAVFERPGRLAAQVKGIRAFTEPPSPEEERALPLEMRTGGFVKPRQELVAKVPFLKDAKGKPIAFDLTYELFFGDIAETGTPPAQLVAMFEGRIPFNQALLPFLTPIGQAVAEIALNKSAFTGADLQRAGERRLPTYLRQAARVALPGAAFETAETALARTGLLQRAGLRPSGRLATAITGTETPIGGAPLPPSLAALGAYGGIRAVSVDAEINRRSRAIALRGRVNEIEREMRSVARDRGRSQQEKMVILARLRQERQRVLQQYQSLGAIRR